MALNIQFLNLALQLLRTLLGFAFEVFDLPVHVGNELVLLGHL